MFGKRHGHGTYHYLDGGKYDGEWVDDKIHGKGTSTYPNGNEYDGEVRCDACQPRGIPGGVYTRGGYIVTRLALVPQWDQGKISGFGTLKYADGDKYIGNWLDGKMHGQGTYVYGDGDKYEGEWKDDKRHGKGTITYRGHDGEVLEKYEVRSLGLPRLPCRCLDLTACACVVLTSHLGRGIGLMARCTATAGTRTRTVACTRASG